MNDPQLSHPASPDKPPALSDTLPHWQQLPAQQQRDTILTLATMVLRRLPWCLTTHLEQQEVLYESAP
jgi:hypothetical protein